MYGCPLWNLSVKQWCHCSSKKRRKTSYLDKAHLSVHLWCDSFPVPLPRECGEAPLSAYLKGKPAVLSSRNQKENLDILKRGWLWWMVHLESAGGPSWLKPIRDLPITTAREGAVTSGNVHARQTSTNGHDAVTIKCCAANHSRSVCLVLWAWWDVTDSYGPTIRFQVC